MGGGYSGLQVQSIGGGLLKKSLAREIAGIDQCREGILWSGTCIRVCLVRLNHLCRE